MRWDKERARKQMARDARDRMAAEAYTRDLGKARPDILERTKKEMRAELELLGVAGDTPMPLGLSRGQSPWSEWKTVTREDGTTYQERERRERRER